MYLLDTNVVIHAQKNYGEVRRRLKACSPDDLAVSVITLAELMYGAEKSATPETTRKRWMDALLPFKLLDFDGAAAYEHARLRWQTRNRPIGERDLFMAALAVAHGRILVTNNLSEFSRVLSLDCEDWTV